MSGGGGGFMGGVQHGARCGLHGRWAGPPPPPPPAFAWRKGNPGRLRLTAARPSTISLSCLLRPAPCTVDRCCRCTSARRCLAALQASKAGGGAVAVSGDTTRGMGGWRAATTTRRSLSVPAGGWVGVHAEGDCCWQKTAAAAAAAAAPGGKTQDGPVPRSQSASHHRLLARSLTCCT